jgi:diacylglycerol kinase (ATP)
MIVVFNPIAGRRRSALLWRVLDVLVANGQRVELLETRHPGHAEELARQAAARGASLIVAAGGDGTIADVAAGIIGSNTRLGVIPLGTANVLAHEIGLSFAPRAVAAALSFRRTRLIWPGIARRPDGNRLFVQMLGAGYDAAVVHAVSPGLKRLLGRGAYVVQGLRTLMDYEFAPLTLRIDGTETRAASVIISKGRFYGGRYMLAPDANPAMAGFTVSLFDDAGCWAAAKYGAGLPLGLLPRMAGLRAVRASRVEILGNACVALQADGDSAGLAPVTITDAPAPIQVVVG